MNKPMKDLELLHGNIIDVAEKLQGMKTLLDVFYKNEIENSETDDTEERIRILSEPYITIINGLGSAISELDTIFNGMDRSLISVGKLLRTAGPDEDAEDDEDEPQDEE